MLRRHLLSLIALFLRHGRPRLAGALVRRNLVFEYNVADDKIYGVAEGMWSQTAAGDHLVRSRGDAGKAAALTVRVERTPNGGDAGAEAAGGGAGHGEL